ncbi:MAG: 3-oxoacyl-ACP reductase [Frankiales bacterium]|nr:3-oxoacyl-ACP reductase [Frankiales bacterium]
MPDELTWPMSIDLRGRVAVVTGASEGIGAATVRALAAHGASVAFCARGAEAADRLAGELTDLPGPVRSYPADLSDAASTHAFLDSVEADLGAADILVNNVGNSPSRNFLHMSDEDWTGLFELNLLSAVRCTRRLLPAMRRGGFGRVVMVSTTGAKYPNPALIDYAASKAAMIATASALSKKYGPDGITVNSVLPGLVRTPMWERTAQEVAAATGTDPEAVFGSRAANVPVRRYGSADEIAALILFLVSPYGGYVNGAAVDVDGGLGTYGF